jgi:hypothetical protein
MSHSRTGSSLQCLTRPSDDGNCSGRRPTCGYGCVLTSALWLALRTAPSRPVDLGEHEQAKLTGLPPPWTMAHRRQTNTWAATSRVTAVIGEAPDRDTAPQIWGRLAGGSDGDRQGETNLGGCGSAGIVRGMHLLAFLCEGLPPSVSSSVVDEAGERAQLRRVKT